MQDFEVKDSCKNDKAGNYLFFLSFIAVYCSKESKLQQRKYPYEKYEDFYLSHLEFFLDCEDSFKKVIAKNNKEDFLVEDYQCVIDEFYKRFITYRTGTIENWLQVIYFVLSFFGVVFVVASIMTKSLNIFEVSFVTTSALISLFMKHFTTRRVILGKIKNPKKIISFFPVRIKNVYKELDQLWKELKDAEKQVIQGDPASKNTEEIKVLEELVQEGQLLRKDGNYLLAGPVNAFLKWKEDQGDIYDIKNKFICENILQQDGAKIKPDTIYQAKSRNKESEKEYLD